jgi:hypothetical protein
MACQAMSPINEQLGTYIPSFGPILRFRNIMPPLPMSSQKHDFDTLVLSTLVIQMSHVILESLPLG